MVTYSVLLSALLAVSFLCHCIRIKGSLPESISALVYDLPKKKQWVWSAWLAWVTLTLAPALFEKAGCVGWLTVICLLGSSLTPLVKTETRKWHYRLSYAAGILTQLCVVIVCPWWLLLWLVMALFILGAMASFNDDNEASVLDDKAACVAEIICYAALVGSLLCAT